MSASATGYGDAGSVTLREVPVVADQTVSRVRAGSRAGAGPVVVVGGSAGALPALQGVISDLPEHFPAPVLVVIHIPTDRPSHLPQILGRAGPMNAVHAVHGERAEPGTVYVAPPDHHLLVADAARRLALHRGPRENRHRPAVDALFRSAAEALGEDVVGVLLSGQRDDGTRGATAVTDRGGTIIVQDPEDARHASMPQHAIRFDHPDAVVPASEIAGRLQDLVAERRSGSTPTTVHQVTLTPSAITCPDCQGVLLRGERDGRLWFECVVGHTYSAESLLVEQDLSLENAVWRAIRAYRERSELCRLLAEHESTFARRDLHVRLGELERTSRERSAVLRGLLESDRSPTAVTPDEPHPEE